MNPELLSAFLDGAVTDEERATVVGWLAESPAAREELEGLRRVKHAVGDLPLVAPPPGFFESMLDRGTPRTAAVVPLRRPWAMAASAVATAAAWVVVAGAPTDATRPPVEQVEAAALGLPGSAVADDDDAPVERAGRLELVETVRAGGDGEATAILGDRGGRTVAVLRLEGAVDWGELSGGHRATEKGTAMWVDGSGGVALVVVVRDDAFYTLASEDFGADALVDLGVALPAGGVHDSWSSRARRACQSLVEALSAG